MLANVLLMGDDNQMIRGKMDVYIVAKGRE